MEPALKQWFLHDGTQQQGPISESEIRTRLATGALTDQAYAWCEGMADWQQIAEIEALLPARPEFGPVLEPPVKQPPPMTKQAPEAAKPETAKPEAAKPAASQNTRDDLSALIEVPNRLEEQTQYLEVGELNKVKKEIRRAEGRPRRALVAVFALVILISAFLLLSKPSRADDSQQQPSPNASNLPSGERMNVQALKNKYWAQGEEEELRVVQNRRYSKSDSLELGLMGGFVSSDPFLSIHAFGASLGYYFSENFEIAVLGWKFFTSSSSALTTLQQVENYTADTNPPRDFFGAEAKWSPLYGKLSLLGEQIIYYDIYLVGGGGETSTVSGSDPTPFVGIGSQIYLSESILLQLTYYQMVYSETVLSAQTGLPATTRTSWNGDVMLGLNFLLF